MLPLPDAWYRRLLVAALGFGAAGGLFALLYSGVTGWGIDLVFGAPTSEAFSGQWWWIPVVSAGALLVAILRRRASLTGHVPGAVAYAQRGWVEPSSAFALVTISAISLMVGASLGPSFGIIVSAGGFSSWVVSRRASSGETEQHDYALTGMTGGLGAIFAAPLFAAVMASELSPTSKRDYVAAFIPQLLAATIGFAIFFSVTGTAILDSFDVPGYDFEYVHLLFGVGLGLASALVLLAFVAISGLIRRASAMVPNPFVRATLFGALIGGIAFALPLAAAGGSSQLAFETDNIGAIGVGLLLAVLLAKMAAVALSLEAGFLGGTVFPMLFIGGTTGVLIHELLPDVPAALAVAAMIAAVPGAMIGAPVSFVLLGAGTVGVGVEGIAPVGLAVVTSHITASALQLRKTRSAG